MRSPQMHRDRLCTGIEPEIVEALAELDDLVLQLLGRAVRAPVWAS